jgi:hypothetical protein
MSPAWEINILRLSLFGGQPSSVSVWADFTGQQPDHHETRSKEQIIREGGPFGGGRLEAVTSAGRLDIVLMPGGPPPSSVTAIAMPPLTVGSIGSALPGFATAAEAWLATYPDPVVRVALGGTLFWAAPDAEKALAQMGPSLHSVHVDPNMRDFLYRVNWRKSVQIGGLTYLNRLTNWAVVTVGFSLGAAVIFEQHFSQMEFDFNSPAENTQPLPMADLSTIFREMRDMLSENAAKGETP